MTRIEEIDLRLKEIRKAADTANPEELSALEAEAQQLMQERAQLAEAAQRRSALLSRIAQGIGTAIPPENGGAPLIEAPQERTDPMTEQEKLLASAEYRTAWLTRMQGRGLTASQQEVLTRAAVSTDNVGAVVPTETANKIIALVKSYAPVFEHLTMVFHINGNFSFALEKSRTRAGTHKQNEEATPSDIDLIDVTLSSYEILKLVQISASVKYMTIDGFEAWLVNMLAQSVAEEINYQLIFGTGTDEGTGIESGNSW